MKRTHFKRIIFLVCLLAIMVGVPVWLTWRQARQCRLDRALIAAIEQRKPQEAMALLDAGADANARQKPQEVHPWWRYIWKRLHGNKPAPTPSNTALVLACQPRLVRHGKLSVSQRVLAEMDLPLIKALVQHGADVNARTAKGEPVIGLAMRYPSVEAVRVLIRHGADVKTPGASGELPLNFAAAWGDVSLMEDIVARGGNVNQKDEYCSPLSRAICSARLERVDWLLEHHADVNAQDKNGDAALHCAALTAGYGRKVLPIIEHLFQAGADVNMANGEGETALMQAAGYGGSVEVVAELLRHGANVNARAKDGSTAVTEAKVYRARQKILRLLRQAGAKE